MDEKFRRKKWTKNIMIFLKSNSNWSQKHKKGLTSISTSGSDCNHINHFYARIPTKKSSSNDAKKVWQKIMLNRVKANYYLLL